jgi:hypothetical protein
MKKIQACYRSHIKCFKARKEFVHEHFRREFELMKAHYLMASRKDKKLRLIAKQFDHDLDLNFAAD